MAMACMATCACSCDVLSSGVGVSFLIGIEKSSRYVALPNSPNSAPHFGSALPNFEVFAACTMKMNLSGVFALSIVWCLVK